MQWRLLRGRESMGSRRRQRFWSICWMFVALDRCTAHFTLHASHVTCHMSLVTPQAARALEAGKVFSGDTLVCCANDCNARACQCSASSQPQVGVAGCSLLHACEVGPVFTIFAHYIRPHLRSRAVQLHKLASLHTLPPSLPPRMASCLCPALQRTRHSCTAWLTPALLHACACLRMRWRVM